MNSTGNRKFQAENESIEKKHTKTGKPLTSKNFKQDNDESLFYLKQNAGTWQEAYLIQSLIAKLLLLGLFI